MLFSLLFSFLLAFFYIFILVFKFPPVKPLLLNGISQNVREDSWTLRECYFAF